MQRSQNIHIVCFDVPYPADYGGAIDVFYKIENLYRQGINIYLHCFTYKNRVAQPTLEKYCKKVFYYPAKNSFLSLLSLIPFRVKKRINNQLSENLRSIKAPILFESLNTIYPLTKFRYQKTFVRTHNIEHLYFYGLAKSERNFFKKIIFYIEGLKLKKFEKHLKKADGIFTISPYEQKYFSDNYGRNTYYIPAFHQAKKPVNFNKKGGFVLYHGNLRVSENVKVALFLIETYKNTEFDFVIASSYREKSVLIKAEKYDNITFKDISKEDELEKLFDLAHINTLLTFQKTGIKLKLINALYQGKHVIANSEMIEDTGLEALCELANSKTEILKKTKKLFSQDFTNSYLERRDEKLSDFCPDKSAKKIIDIIFRQ